MNKNITVVIGAQWGDEGKGKWVDHFAKDSDFIIRFQGGNNAGHTLYINGTKLVLHQIPSGILHDEKICALGAGVVMNPYALKEEIEKVRSIRPVTPKELAVSAKAHVITPWHIWLDIQFEKSRAFLGTTKRGIGPTYQDKAARSGLRVSQYIDDEFRLGWIQHMTASIPEFSQCLKEDEKGWQQFHEAAATLRPYVSGVETNLRKHIKENKKILIEGAQGTLLDVSYGTYPFVTSSSTIAGGAAASLGIPPKYISHTVGIAKAYITRVGEGPMPTEINDSVSEEIARKGSEFGASTGRPRRVGWFDAVAMRYAQEINGFDYIILNKLDILCGLAELKIATHYEHPTLGVLEEFPDNAQILAEVKPRYISLPGFSSIKDISGQNLSKELKTFIEAIEEHSQIKVGLIGVGSGRDDFIRL